MMVLNMLIQGLSRKLAGSLFTFILAVLVSGCGGGGGESEAVQETTPITNNVVHVVARTGPILAVRVGETARLDGNNSFTSSSESLLYSWTFTHKPFASKARLLGATTVGPSFVADVSGVYMAQLVVSAESISSQRAVEIVVATVPPDDFTGPVNHQGLSSSCVTCHNGDFELVPGVSKIPGKSITHFATSNSCQTCHTPQGFAIIPYVDHLEIFGKCSECHNGELAIGKSESHVLTIVECDNCHNTNHFIALEPDNGFDHTGITTGCTVCHNGTVSIGKPEGHIDTNAECVFCHTTASFQNAYPDHKGPEVVGKRCDSCHNDSLAAGQSTGHPVTNVDCAICHNIVSFSLDGIFDHGVVDSTVQPCELCHNGDNSINAPGKSSAPVTHLATTADCGSCHNTRNFQGAFVDHTLPVVLNARCDSCHGVTSVGKPAVVHLITTEDCRICHTPGTFQTGVFAHAPSYIDPPALCADCHNNVVSVGQLFNHLPTVEDCSACHNTTDFALATFDHVGIDTANCGLCHNNIISTGKSENHLPTNLDCSSCHTINNFDSFAGIIFNHLGIDNNNCALCHDTGISTGKKVNHIPAQSECSTCHNSTDSFASTTFLATIHQDLTRGCEGCHTSQFFPNTPNVVKSVSHLPTIQDCYICHTTTAFIPSIFDHLGIIDNCTSCHDGSANNIAVGALGKTNTAIHQNTSGDCSVCHNTINFADAFVDHTGPEVVGKRCDSCHNGTDATGKDAKINPSHVATNEDCSVCHLPGGSFSPAVFNHQGIVDNCASCHDGVAAVGKSDNHLPTAQDCSVCHITTAFAGATYDHQGIVDNCVSCHDGVIARGKIPPPNHVPTNGDCSVCHQTTGFIPGIFEHVGIVDNCASCHDAGFAKGKSENHVETTQDCGVCHTTTTFVGAVFDHTGIVDNCASCHGVTAKGKDANHVETTLDCHFCHTTATFVGGTFDHQGITGDCMSCHDGSTAIGKSLGHFFTTQECNVCHTTQGWAPIDYTHSGNSDYPGDHRANLGCISCHTDNNESITYPTPAFAGFCASCHAMDYESDSHHTSLEVDKNCAGSGCHKVTDRKFD